MPFLKVDNAQLHYNDTRPSGDATGRATVVFHHGMGSTAGFYTPLIHILAGAPHRLRCISFDAASCGQSSSPTAETSLQRMADHTLALLDHLAVQQAVVVGHSISSIMIPDMLLQHGGRFSAAVLIGPVLPGERVSSAISSRLAALERG